jgi:type II secretory pathway pseudopilin PulG
MPARSGIPSKLHPQRPKTPWSADCFSLPPMVNRRMETEHGFSLIEALCATAIFITGLAALAQLLAVTTRLNNSAKATTVATVMAVEKMEQLRSLAWGFDSLRLPLSDATTDVTALPESASGAGLSRSPPDSLVRNSSGYCDFLDRSGQSIGRGSNPPPGAAYVRRWSIDPLPADVANTLVLQVRVMARTNGGVDDAAGARRRPDEAWIVTVKTRKGR